MCFPLIMMFHLPRWKKFLTFIHRYEKNIFLHHRRLVTQRYGRIVHFSPLPSSLYAISTLFLITESSINGLVDTTELYHDVVFNLSSDLSQKL